jgi:putative ABC transport system permease protein
MGGNKEAEEILSQFKIDLIPLSKLHFSLPIDYDHVVHGNRNYVLTLFFIGLGILILAIINFVNINVARNFENSKDTGIKKLMGASDFSIVGQSIIKSVIVCFVALILSRIFVEFLFEVFNKANDYSLNYRLLNRFSVIFATILITIIVGTICGFFPAITMTRENVINNLKNKFSKGKSAGYYRQGMVVFQFVVSSSLIIFTLFIIKQTKYLNSTDLGFDKTNCIEMSAFKLENKQVFREVILKNPNIEDFTYINSFLGYNDGNTGFVSIEHKGNLISDVPFKWRKIDKHFVNATGVKIKESLDLSSHTDGWIINESAVKRYGLSDDPFESKIMDIPVIGIIEDFHYTSLHNNIEPFAFRYTPHQSNGRFAIIRFKPKADRRETINFLKSEWKTLASDIPFEYQEYSDKFSHMYKKEKQLKNLIVIFSIVAIIIACLGLFSWSLFSIAHRTKEIGIRRVNGAKAIEILKLLNVKFLSASIIAFVISCPIGFFLIRNWLQAFAYKTSISWDIFTLSGMAILIISILTITWQTWIAANRNPVQTLRCE